MVKSLANVIKIIADVLNDFLYTLVLTLVTNYSLIVD